jgi:hypothetical protein
MTRIPFDPHTNVVNECYALIYAPGRRDRFPENCVTLVDSEQDAIDGADSARKLFPALVMGPSRSSEGFMLYYLVRWLE